MKKFILRFFLFVLFVCGHLLRKYFISFASTDLLTNNIDIDQVLNFNESMEKSECNFNYEPFRRVPMNSATTQREWTDYNSVGTFSTNSNWSKSRNPPITTTYIDGRTMLDQNHRQYSTKSSFPKAKPRPKPAQSAEKKVVISLPRFPSNDRLFL